ncbi:MAG: DUF4914 family protein [Elusimicrobiota bacterium]
MNKFKNIKLKNEIKQLLDKCPEYTVANSVEEMVPLAYADAKPHGWHEVSYDIPGRGKVTEAKVCKVKNGVAANYVEEYMRRRDPESMVIADDFPSDKPRFKDRFGYDFNSLRKETFQWLENQRLCVFFFNAGPGNLKLDAIAIAPANAAFFALGLGLLQGVVDTDKLDRTFEPKAFVLVAPTFRHTHFKGKQIVVHRRKEDFHEMFSYNLYPGPSAKKGVYGMLINKGEREDWVTLHCSTVKVTTPYDNALIICHEGASGGGKSEMNEDMHRERSGKLLLGKNILTEEEHFLTLPLGCSLQPITDDMAVSHPSYSRDNGKLCLTDAENAWFIRVNHIDSYGADLHLEELSAMARDPILFLNIDAAPDSTALIWDHIEDKPGKPCPNPRLVLPRWLATDAKEKPVEVDIRSFGVRTPPCTSEKPTYGIIGLFHVIPSALAWLWRLVSPRGHGNPSIVDSEGMSSEGVGSYWPFATGKKVRQANLLLKQIMDTPKVRYILTPNQHIGAWKVGFMPQWLTREYLARRGGAWFTSKHLTPARSSLLGYALKEVMIEGHLMEKEFLQVERQPEVGRKAYDTGSAMLRKFFHDCITQYLDEDLMPEGKRIIECCLDGGSVKDYCSLIPTEPIIQDSVT